MRSSTLLTKDVVSGLLFIGIGIVFLWIGMDYRFGTNRQMGPGYFPVVLSGLLIGLGVLIILMELRNAGHKIEPLSVKGIIFVLGAIMAFAFLIRPAGMPVAVFVLSFVGAMASSQFRLIPALLLSIGLVVFCVVVFNWALGMPFPIWGYWFR